MSLFSNKTGEITEDTLKDLGFSKSVWGSPSRQITLPSITPPESPWRSRSPRRYTRERMNLWGPEKTVWNILPDIDQEVCVAFCRATYFPSTYSGGVLNPSGNTYEKSGMIRDPHDVIVVFLEWSSVASILRTLDDIIDSKLIHKSRVALENWWGEEWKHCETVVLPVNNLHELNLTLAHLGMFQKYVEDLTKKL